MRLWHYKLFKYLPDRQFRGQLREVLVIMRTWRDKGKTNSLIINQVMNYPKEELYSYFVKYCSEYKKRYNKEVRKQYRDEFKNFCDRPQLIETIFNNWHNNIYLKMCMTNLYEKYYFGVGRSKLTVEEWNKLLDGYRILTREEYEV